MGELFLACYSETAEAARGNDANCLATFPQNGAIANVGYEGSSSPSDGDSSVRCMSTDGREPPIGELQPWDALAGISHTGSRPDTVITSDSALDSQSINKRTLWNSQPGVVELVCGRNTN